MKISKITSAECRFLDAELEKVMNVFAAKYGLTYERGSASYNPESVSIKVCLKTVGGSQKEVTQNNSMLGHYGLSINEQVRSSRNGVILTIVGFNPRRPKNAVQLKGSDGRSYKASIEYCVSRKIK